MESFLRGDIELWVRQQGGSLLTEATIKHYKQQNAKSELLELSCYGGHA